MRTFHYQRDTFVGNQPDLLQSLLSLSADVCHADSSDVSLQLARVLSLTSLLAERGCAPFEIGLAIADQTRTALPSCFAMGLAYKHASGDQHWSPVLVDAAQPSVTQSVASTGYFQSPLSDLRRLQPSDIHCSSDGGYIRDQSHGSSSWIVSTGPEDRRVVVACGVEFHRIANADVNYFELHATDIVSSLMTTRGRAPGTAARI